MDRKNLDKAHLLIKKHIETISVGEIQDYQKEKEYSLLRKDVEFLMISFNNHFEKNEKKVVKMYIEKVRNVLYRYLITYNRYDYKILQLYVMLEDILKRENLSHN